MQNFLGCNIIENSYKYLFLFKLSSKEVCSVMIEKSMEVICLQNKPKRWLKVTGGFLDTNNFLLTLGGKYLAMQCTQKVFLYYDSIKLVAVLALVDPDYKP